MGQCLQERGSDGGECGRGCPSCQGPLALTLPPTLTLALTLAHDTDPRHDLELPLLRLVQFPNKEPNYMPKTKRYPNPNPNPTLTVKFEDFF